MASATVYLINLLLGALTPLSVTGDCLQNVLFNGNYEFIDLTHNFNNRTVNWPFFEKFRFTKKIVAYDTEGFAANEYASAEHTGTHIDAPYHFYEPGKKVGELPLDNFIIPLVVIDVSSKVNGNPNYVLYKKDLGDKLKDLKRNGIVLFRFGWSQYYHDYQKYLGMNGSTLNFPGLSIEVAKLITTKYKNVVGVGVDVASLDPGASTDYPVHKIFSKAGLYNMEQVNLKKRVNGDTCTALVMPMKIQQGTGAPLRLVAICPKETSSN